MNKKTQDSRGVEHPQDPGHHCHSHKGRVDYLLWASLTLVVLLYLYALFGWAFGDSQEWLGAISLSVYELINTLWWGLALGILAIGFLGKVPRELIMALLGTHSGFRGIVRATVAGVLLDLCSHGILMVGAKLYERGATVGQVMAFLIASPWNSFSLTLVLIALIGLGWTLTFILCSLLIGILVGLLFDRSVSLGVLPSNPNKFDLPKDFKPWAFFKEQWRAFKPSVGFFRSLLLQGILDARVVIKWLMFGVLLASLIRALMPPEMFSDYFGPTFLGLLLTVLVATILEVCSEGSTPIAADILTQAKAPGNGFAFLMSGVATDYTEIMILKETTSSWKIALFLPLFTMPQVLLVAWLLNQVPL
jgi:uncharacterized membrane protein YraQ (UPF0718 family)